jgi:hypothetical protein
VPRLSRTTVTSLFLSVRFTASALRTIMLRCGSTWELAVGILATYLSALRDIDFGEGVSELSYYPALRDLLRRLGRTEAKVRCFMNLKIRAPGLPDGGCSRPIKCEPRGARAGGAQVG